LDPRTLLDQVFERSRVAYEVVERYVHRTPLDRSRTFSELVGAEVYLKCENLQKTGAFKVRGALFKVYNLAKQGVKGVVAASAGNHAQGVAYASRTWGLRAVIVMPETASISKIEATKSYGAEVVLYGSVYDEAERKAWEIAESEGLVFVHPFNDIDVMAGQGTIAWELIEQLHDFDAVVVPIGGGGLASGILAVLKKMKPNVKVIGVEPENAPKMLSSIRSGRITEIEVKPTLADGLATKRPGDLTYTIVSNFIDDIVTVSEDELATAIYMLLERAKLLVEGAGAASIAALLSGKVRVRGRVVALITGGNIDVTALYRILLRGLVAAGRVVKLRGYVPDVPGALRGALEIIAKYRGNIVDIRHDRYDVRASPWYASVEILLEVPSRDVVKSMLNDLERRGYRFTVVD